MHTNRTKRGGWFGMLAFGACVALTVAGYFGWVRAAEPEGIAWQTDLKAAQKLAAASGKPLLIVFDAEWCATCKSYENSTLANPTMVSYVSRDFVPVRLDWDKNQEVGKVLEVKILPTTVVLSAEADVLGTSKGYQSPQDLWKALEASKRAQTKIRQARYGSATAVR